MSIKQWMSWEAGIDLVAITSPDLRMPNVIVHVARMVHTPVGSAASGMLFYQPDTGGAPELIGFISTDEKVGAYFGPNIFAGTPFEKAPVLKASIEIRVELPGSVSSIVKVEGTTIEVTLSELKAPELISRPPAVMPPFHQQGVEAAAGRATLKVNGKDVSIVVPPVGISGGPAAVWAPTGIYAR